MAVFKKAYEKAKAEWPNLPRLPAKYKTQLERGKAKIADLPWNEDYDDEQYGDGTYRVRIRRPAVSKKGVHQKIKIIGKSGKPLTGEDAEFGNKSIVVVGFSVKAWHSAQHGFGVTFLPDIIQVREAKFEGGGGIEEYGFEVDEDAEDDEESPPFDEYESDDDKGEAEDEDF